MFLLFGQNDDQVSTTDSSEVDESEYHLKTSDEGSSDSFYSYNEFLPNPSPVSSSRQDHLSVDSVSSRRVTSVPPVQILSLQEEVDQIIDHSIEMDSIKQIRDEHVHPLTLHFLLPDLESTVTATTHTITFCQWRGILLFCAIFSSAICGRILINPMPSASSLFGFC